MGDHSRGQQSNISQINTSSLLQMRSLCHEDNIYPSEEVPSAVSPRNTLKRKKCNCKNSKCLKLYCECFASKMYCDDCNCIGCSNTPENKEIVKNAISATLSRNPKAFSDKIKYQDACSDQGQVFGQHRKGCHCKKSHCLKKYCECYQAGILCGDNCKCLDCKNYSQTSQGSLFNRSSSLSPPQKRMRPTSVPPETMLHFKSSPPRNTRNPNIKSQFKINDLVDAAVEEERNMSLLSASADSSDFYANREQRPLVKFSPIQKTTRSASAPVNSQDPTAIRDLLGMMGNTVSISPFGVGLSLAPLKRTPSPLSPSHSPFTQRPILHAPTVAIPQARTTSIGNSANNIDKKKVIPTIGGSGAFKKPSAS
mmetsp:Transcript_16946/g.28867  ORF Transcript_16946/g.28867 Transcript_16946/m.28867 type:complete len:367 (+) Transcript_16946:65-1165(+)